MFRNNPHFIENFVFTVQFYICFNIMEIAGPKAKRERGCRFNTPQQLCLTSKSEKMFDKWGKWVYTPNCNMKYYL